MVKIGKYSWNPLILFRNLVILICLIIITWFTISYCEVLIKNTTIEVRPEYSSWNFFIFADNIGR